MDLGALDSVKDCNEGAEMTLTHYATGEDTDITIRCAGPDSDAFQKANRKLQDRRMQQTLRGGKRKMTSEDLDEDAIELLAACTMGWSDTLHMDGEKHPYSHDNAKNLYRRFPWIREQVNRFVGDRANFFRGADNGS